MNYKEYIAEFDRILTDASPQEPYDNPEFIEYTKLNQKRMSRWEKTGKITEPLSEKIQSIQGKQKWVLIAEPWCGDTAHLTPFIAKMAAQNPNISLEIQLRDTDSEIENYLTNGAKAIPKLIIRDENGNDIATWGARPEACQSAVNQWKNDGIEKTKLKANIQNWYNEDKGASIQKEFMEIL